MMTTDFHLETALGGVSSPCLPSTSSTLDDSRGVGEGGGSVIVDNAGVNTDNNDVVIQQHLGSKIPLNTLDPRAVKLIRRMEKIIRQKDASLETAVAKSRKNVEALEKIKRFVGNKIRGYRKILLEKDQSIRILEDEIRTLKQKLESEGNNCVGGGEGKIDFRFRFSGDKADIRSVSESQSRKRKSALITFAEILCFPPNYAHPVSGKESKETTNLNSRTQSQALSQRLIWCLLEDLLIKYGFKIPGTDDFRFISDSETLVTARLLPSSDVVGDSDICPCPFCCASVPDLETHLLKSHGSSVVSLSAKDLFSDHNNHNDDPNVEIKEEPMEIAQEDDGWRNLPSPPPPLIRMRRPQRRSSQKNKTTNKKKNKLGNCHLCGQSGDLHSKTSNGEIKSCPKYPDKKTTTSSIITTTTTTTTITTNTTIPSSATTTTSPTAATAFTTTITTTKMSTTNPTATFQQESNKKRSSDAHLKNSSKSSNSSLITLSSSLSLLSSSSLSSTSSSSSSSSSARRRRRDPQVAFSTRLRDVIAYMSRYQIHPTVISGTKCHKAVFKMKRIDDKIQANMFSTRSEFVAAFREEVLEPAKARNINENEIKKIREMEKLFEDEMSAIDYELTALEKMICPLRSGDSKLILRCLLDKVIRSDFRHKRHFWSPKQFAKLSKSGGNVPNAPICLERILEKLQHNGYESKDDFLADVELIHSNTVTVFGLHSDEEKLAAETVEDIKRKVHEHFLSLNNQD